MQKRFQRGGLDQGIAEYLGLKGQYSATIDDNFVPTVQVADLAASPYAADYFPVARQVLIAALAANYAYLVIRPGTGVTLQVESIRVHNNTAATVRFVTVLLTAADIAILVATGVLNSTNPMLGRVLGRAPSQLIVPERSSAISSIHSTTRNVSAPIDDFVLATNLNAMVSLPSPGVILTNDGTPGTTPGGIAVLADALAGSISMSVAGREWPLAG